MITLATLANATAQQVFDQVAAHLIAQGKPAKNGKGYCVYRNDEGLKCAGGCLIGDDEYSPEFEFNRWAGLIEDGFVPDVHHKLINQLQLLHDSMVEVADFNGRLRSIAKYHSLNTHVLDGIK